MPDVRRGRKRDLVEQEEKKVRDRLKQLVKPIATFTLPEDFEPGEEFKPKARPIQKIPGKRLNPKPRRKRSDI